MEYLSLSEYNAPWVIEQTEDNSVLILDQDDAEVCRITDEGFKLSSRSLRNMTLIVLAPAMLEAIMLHMKGDPRALRMMITIIDTLEDN